MNLEQLKQRFIPFASLQYTTEAFIDYAIDECSPKYNYALIGPGVSQNPKQPVSLREPHGFQLGGVSIPHGKTNPPHMHFTCEVFMCFRGDWRVMWGFNPDEKHTVLSEGDVISVPTWIYRAFRNVGVDDGFLFSGLGRDDTGGILWGPWTIEQARKAGVYLTEDYRMIDTRRGDVLPSDVRLLDPMTAEQIAALEDWTPERMLHRVVRFSDLRWSGQALLDSVIPGHGAEMAPVIGLGMDQGRAVIPPVANAHGMSIEWLRIPVGGKVGWFRLQRKQALVLKKGQVRLEIQADDGTLSQLMQGTATAWDSFAIPADHWRSLHNEGSEEALILLLTSGDEKKSIEWSAEVIEQASAHGWTMDANGCVAPKYFVDRAQR
ncbi:MAG: cupin domain-containing protein [Limnohabitans sp.]|jgi:quercetin dioxygenase-like cupin family protein|nr:cupin domain-containing protein [Limnohabitans sp.]